MPLWQYVAAIHELPLHGIITTLLLEFFKKLNCYEISLVDFPYLLSFPACTNKKSVVIYNFVIFTIISCNFYNFIGHINSNIQDKQKSHSVTTYT